MTTTGATGGWYWCLRHEQAEETAACAADDRLGPYESKEAAEHWRERAEARNEKWDEENRAWSGDDPE